MTLLALICAFSWRWIKAELKAFQSVGVMTGVHYDGWRRGGGVLKAQLVVVVVFFCFGIAVNWLVFLSSEEILWKGFRGDLSCFS